MKINIQAIINNSTKAQLQGLVSRGIKEAELDDNGHLIFTLTDNSTVDIGRVAGDPGEDGADGADGHTPVKGTDYWTAADKQGIVNDVLAALPTWTGGSY